MTLVITRRGPMKSEHRTVIETDRDSSHVAIGMESAADHLLAKRDRTIRRLERRSACLEFLASFFLAMLIIIFLAISFRGHP